MTIVGRLHSFVTIGDSGEIDKQTDGKTNLLHGGPQPFINGPI